MRVLCCPQDLQAIGVEKRGYILRLEKAIRKQVPPLFQSRLPVSTARVVRTSVATTQCTHIHTHTFAHIHTMTGIFPFSQSDIGDFLESVHLDEYLPILKAEGYSLAEDVENMIGLSKDDLRTMGVTKRGRWPIRTVRTYVRMYVCMYVCS